MNIPTQYSGFLDDILSAIYESFLILDLNLSVLAANKPFCDLFKLTPKEILGHSIYEIGNKQWNIAGLKSLLDGIVLQHSKFENYELDHVFKSIDHKILLINGYRITHIEDNTSIILLTFEDITALRLCKEYLQKSEERSHTIAEAVVDAVIMINQEGNICFWNKSAERIFGYSKAEVMGQPLHYLLAPMRYHAAHNKAFSHFLETGKGDAIGRTLELEAIHKGGEEFPIELSLAAVNVDGHWQAIGVIRDITERKQADRALVKSEERFQQIAENLGEIIWEVDPNGLYLYCSSAVEKILGYTPDELVGKKAFL